jgi:hypothetical protein
VTVTNEGSRPAGSFYYQIDYRQVEDIKPEVPIFMPNTGRSFPVKLAVIT